MSSVSNGLYFLTLPLVSVMRVIYRKIRRARYLYIKMNVEKVWGARYLSKNMVFALFGIKNALFCSILITHCNQVPGNLLNELQTLYQTIHVLTVVVILSVKFRGRMQYKREILVTKSKT